MNWFEKAIAASYVIWNENGLPPYGWFHWVWILATLVASVFFSWFFRKRNGLSLRIFCLSYSVLMVLLEVWKECGESYKLNEATGNYEWHYNWQFFPLQLCSTPMYIALLAGLICKGKFQNALFAYLGTYGLFGALITYAVPMEILGYQALFSLFHTMFFHGAMITICTTLLVNHVDLRPLSALFASLIFLFFVGLSEILNVVFYVFKPDYYISLMHISPFYVTRLPIFPSLQKIHFTLFISAYVILFVFIAFLLLYIRKFIGWLITKLKLKVKVWRETKRKKNNGDMESLGYASESQELLVNLESDGNVGDEEKREGDEEWIEEELETKKSGSEIRKAGKGKREIDVYLLPD